MRRILFLLPFFTVLIFAFTSSAQGTFTANSCSVADVANCINATGTSNCSPGGSHTAVSGDTIIIPNGSCSWASGISIPVPIILKGQTSPGYLTGCMIPANCNLTITDTDTNTGHNLLTFNADNSHHIEIANISFMPLNAACSPSCTPQGTYITINGITSNLIPLVHDVSINQPCNVFTHSVVWGTPGGVIWNSNWYTTDTACGAGGSINNGSLEYIDDGNWDVTSTMGNLDTLGTANLYLENSTCTGIGQFPDGGNNARIVVRYVNELDCSGLTHGSTDVTAGRHVEYYSDVLGYVPVLPGFSNTNQLPRYFWWRAGTGLFTDDQITWIHSSGFPNNVSLQMAAENLERAGTWGCCTGYMCYHQVGAGSSSSTQSPTKVSGSPQTATDVFQISQQMYFWNNNGSGAGLLHITMNDGSDPGGNCNITNPATGNFWTTTDVFVLNRDWEETDANPTTIPQPSWVPYTYPHPLNSSGTKLVAIPVQSMGNAAVQRWSGTPTSDFVYSGTQTLTLSEPLTAGATILFTTDNTTPSHGAACAPTGTTTTYSVPFAVTLTETVKAIGCESGFVDSFVGSNTYTINATAQLASPTMSPVAGNYSSTQTITLSGPAGATICYTTNGTYPWVNDSTNTCGSQPGFNGNTTQTYSGTFTVKQTSNIIAVATKTGSTDSIINSGLYQIGTFNPPAGTPAFSPVAGTYVGNQAVSITASPSTVICYNTTGSPATNGSSGCPVGSTLYTGPITVAANETVFAAAGGTGFTDTLASAAYIINPPPPISNNKMMIGEVLGNGVGGCTPVPKITALCLAGDDLYICVNGTTCKKFITSVTMKPGTLPSLSQGTEPILTVQ